MRFLHKNQHTQRKISYFVNGRTDRRVGQNCDLDGEAGKIEHIFTKQSFSKKIGIENVNNRVALLISYSYRKIIFRMIKLIFNLAY